MSEDIKTAYDLAIIGAGPAGLSASVYASRYGLKNVVIGGVTGGLTTQTHEIGNWLGEQKITGFEFAQKADAHAKSLGAEFLLTTVDTMEKNADQFELTLADGKKVEAKAVLLAMGTKHRHLEVSGEKELAGKGVSYCATCDGFFFRGKTVAVVGGNDSAAGAAVYLGNIAEKVYVIYRRGELRCEQFWRNSIENNPKIEVIVNNNVTAIIGENRVEKIELATEYQGKRELNVNGVFVEIGLDPNTSLAETLGIDLDEEGFIKINQDGATSIEGVWAAGDITTGSNKFRQIVTAAAEGAVAANSIQRYLKR